MNNIIKHVNSDTAVILATGSSINLITNEQWDKLLKYDTVAMNNWCYHKTVVPKFYHMEVRQDEKLMKRRIEEKWDKYKDVLWLVEAGRSNIINAIGHTDTAKILWYNGTKNSSGKYGHTSNIEFVRSHSASITLIIDMVYKIGYKNVIFAGVDLSNSKYFWTDDPTYGEVHLQWNKQHNGDGKTMNDRHKVYPVKDFIFNMNEQFMLPNGREMFILSKETALYPRLKLWKV